MIWSPKRLQCKMFFFHEPWQFLQVSKCCAVMIMSEKLKKVSAKFAEILNLKWFMLVLRNPVSMYRFTKGLKMTSIATALWTVLYIV